MTRTLGCRYLQMYDIFYVSRTTGNDTDWATVKSKYSTAQRLSNIESFDQIKSRAFTKMFWVIWDDIILNDSFDLSEYAATKWDDQYVHVFKNGEHYDGIVLFSKNTTISKKEFKYRFFNEKKEIDCVISYPKAYDKFIIQTYAQYLEVIEKSSTDLFWIIPPGVQVVDNFNFDLYFSHHNQYDRNIIHSFQNSDFYDGVMLVPKSVNISENEFNYGHIINKKEYKILASMPVKFDKFEIATYDDYLTAMANSTTGMFWAVWPDVEVVEDFEYNYYVPKYEQHIPHVFKNGEYFDGLCLFSKKVAITKKEFDYRFFMNKKEIDVVASRPRSFEIYNIKTYDDYLKAKELSPTEMFWALWDDINVAKDFKFDYYVPTYDTFHRNITHVFKNGEYYDGIVLFSKNTIISKKEFDHRFFVNKKEVDVQASTPKPFDIVFISYNEPNADDNFIKLKETFPRAKRIHGVKGIHQAHVKAAELATTEMFWVVDGDAKIVDEFNFSIEYFPYYDTGNRLKQTSTVFVWSSQNPINNLVYGYGGVKLLPRKLTIDMDMSSTDMTTSISKLFKAMPSVSNITVFNTDPFSSWRSAFRECVKLSSRSIDRQNDKETADRLDAWCSLGTEKPFGKDAIRGAKEGRKYGETHKGNIEALVKINDFDWLKGIFNDVK